MSQETPGNPAPRAPENDPWPRADVIPIRPEPPSPGGNQPNLTPAERAILDGPDSASLAADTTEAPPPSTPPSLPAGGRRLAAAGFSPGRDELRANRKAVAEANRAHGKAVTDARRAALEAEKRERHEAAYLPPRGDPGPSRLRSYRRLRIEPHRATSDALGIAYPFLAEAGLGTEGVLIGHDSWSGSAFVYDPWVLYQMGLVTNPNGLLAGVIGRGKSTLAKALATRSIAFGRRVYVPGDPKGEWTVVSRAVGGVAIELGGGLSNRLNPLDPGPRVAGMSDEAWAQTVATRRLTLLVSLAESALGRGLVATEHTALGAALSAAVGGWTVPTLPAVVGELLHPAGDGPGSTRAQLESDGREVGHALGRLVHGDLAGLFDGPSTVTFDPSLPMVSLDLSRISGSDQLMALVMACASAWMEAALANPAAGQRWIIYDEAWRLIAQPALLARMQSQWKLSRALGIANLLVIHRLSDLDAVGDANSGSRNLALGLLADCSTRIIYAQEQGEAEKTGRAIGLSETEIAQLPDMQRGEGLWRIGERAFVVRHDCTPAELDLFDTNSRMVGKSDGFGGIPTEDDGTEDYS